MGLTHVWGTHVWGRIIFMRCTKPSCMKGFDKLKKKFI